MSSNRYMYMTKKQIEEMATNDVNQRVEKDLNEIFEEMRQEFSKEGLQPQEIEAAIEEVRKPLHDRLFFTYKPHAEFMLNQLAVKYGKAPQKNEEEKSPSLGPKKN